MKRIVALVFIVIISIVFIVYAFNFVKKDSTLKGKGNTELGVPDSILFTDAPVLTPGQALHTFQLQEGFGIELVASEPLIHDPVAITFDDNGRIWVIEMQSYMPDMAGSGEDEKISRIVILEDQDKDGVMDHSKVFLENLVLPRAIAIVDGGILYAEPPNLWFIENNDDTPGNKTLVDSSYATGGNVEHQPNGLMRGMDNWYYNAKSKFKYKYLNGEWVKEETEFRGQWGITMDNYGRLFYNTNSNQLRGDLVPPNALNKNPDFNADRGYNVEIVANQNVYPIRPTTGINRGYQEHMLDQNQKLRQFTAACGPLIYRGDNFPEAFLGNAFVCEPAANLIKRNVLLEKGQYLIGKQAYNNSEFLASTDERFRPVSLNNAPDGSMYVVDMYRGIIQHETYLTDYLKDQIRSRNLEKPVGYGRIYRIVYKGRKKDEVEDTNKDLFVSSLKEVPSAELVDYLSDPNGWWRDNAQQILVERNDKAIVSELKKLLRQEYINNNKLHALWTLEGMGVFSPDIIELGIQEKDPKVIANALRIGERNSDKEDAKETLNLYEEVLINDHPTVQLQLALSLGAFMRTDSEQVLKMLKNIALKNGKDELFREAIVSSIFSKEENFIDLLNQDPNRPQELITLIKTVIENARIKKQLDDNELTEAGKKQYIAGKVLYEKTCTGCHNVNGGGLVPIAPPLAGSEWVVGPKERLILIALHGLTGPITVNGKIYKEPEVQSVMPGLKDNSEIEDEELAALLTYIRNAWGNRADEVDGSEINAIRKSSMDRNEPYTESELMK